MKRGAVVWAVVLFCAILAACKLPTSNEPDPSRLAASWHGRIVQSANVPHGADTPYEFTLVFDSLEGGQVHGTMLWPQVRTVTGTYDGRLVLMDEDHDQKVATVRGPHMKGTDKNGTWDLEATADEGTAYLTNRAPPPPPGDPPRANEATPLAAARVISLVLLVLLIAILAGFWGVFRKAGEPGWAALVPVYSAVVLVRVTRTSMWWVPALFVVPIGCAFFRIPFVPLLVDIAFWVVAARALANAYGKGTLFAVGLFVMPFIFLPILAFGDADYLE